MKIYKEMGINPLASCLPLLIQFPIMIGLYQSISLAMAQAPIQLLNLSRSIYTFIPASLVIPVNSQFLMDKPRIARVQTPPLPFALPIIGYSIPIMTILVVLTTYLQSKLMTPATRRTSTDQGAQMSRSMNLMMPVMMGFITWSLASGLALYFIVSNLLGIAQYAMMGNVHWSNLLPKRKAVPAK